LKCAFLSGDLRKPELLLEHLLHVTDFTLYLPACFFRRPAIAQVWIPCRLAGLFFHFALRFLESALDFILVLDFIRTKSRAMNAAVVNWFATEGDRHTEKRPNTLIKPDLSSALLVASLPMTALFFALALLPLAFLSLAIFVLALLSGTTRFARFVRIVL
jgi:hypothetical protein